MFKSHNAYSILGLKENANSNSVRQAYHEQALRNHPDKGGDPDRMKSINAAYYTLLQQIEEQTVNSDFLDKSMEKLNEILKRKIPEHIRDDVDEASNKHRELHSAFVEQFKQDDIKRISAYTHFKKFKTNLYYDITLDNNEVCIVSYEDLFDLVSQKKLLTEHKKLEQLPNAISPQIAVEIFIKFIEGACFGYNLIAAKCLINAQLKITNKTEPTYNLYSGILEILNMEEINSGQEGDLLKSLNKITDFARDQPEQTMPYFAPLLQNIYFRTLFSQALHLFWQEHSRNFKETDRTILNNLKMTKNYLSVLAKRVLDNDKNGIEDNNVLTVTAVVKKLYEFELFINKEMDKSHSDVVYMLPNILLQNL